MEAKRTEEITYYTHPSLGVFEVTISRYTDEYREKFKKYCEDRGYPRSEILPSEEDLVDVRVKSPNGKIIDIKGAAAIGKTEEETREEIRETLRISLIRAKQHGQI